MWEAWSSGSQKSFDDLGTELIHLTHQLGLSGFTLSFDLSPSLFASAIGFGLRFSKSLAVETVHLLFGLDDGGLGRLTGSTELVLEIGFQSLYLLKLLLGISTTGGDVALTISTTLPTGRKKRTLSRKVRRTT